MEKLTVQRELCDGCGDCENTCNSLHNTSRIKIIEYDSAFYSVVCQQCEDAPCEIICPTGAMTSTDVNSDKCIACGLCVMACPFGAITIANKNAEKCNRCMDRKEGPACIKACSKRAISLVDIDKVKARKHQEYIEKLPGKSKKPKKNSLLNILTSGARINSE